MNGRAWDRIRWLRIPAAVLLAWLPAAASMAAAAAPPAAGAPELSVAAEAFLAGLTEGEREQASWPFADDERTDIHYAPINLDGLRHGELPEAAHQAGERLLAAALSEAGLTRVHQVQALEAVIREQESFLMNLSGLRDPGRYFWAIFGDPGLQAPWAFRYEGHHLSLNVTVTDAGVATTPLFIGAQPRVVPEGLDVGPPPGTAVLGEEERLARTLYASFDPGQRQRATLDYQPDRGLMIGQVARVDPPDPVGLSRREMDPVQRRLLDELIDQLAGVWNETLAAARRAEVAAARDALHFAHAEADDPPDSFYTRISAPSLLIEIDNTEGGDHVHAVWHSPEGDFGADLLARHLAEHHGVELVRRD